MSTKPHNAIWCPMCGGDKGHAVPDRLASIGSVDGYAERWEECRHCDAEGWIIPECSYCDRTDGLRLHHDGGSYIAPDYVCEDCFHGDDDGPGFDDLPLAQAEARP